MLNEIIDRLNNLIWSNAENGSWLVCVLDGLQQQRLSNGQVKIRFRIPIQLYNQDVIHLSIIVDWIDWLIDWLNCYDWTNFGLKNSDYQIAVEQKSPNSVRSCQNRIEILLRQLLALCDGSLLGYHRATSEPLPPSEVFAERFALVQCLRQVLVQRFGQHQGEEATHHHQSTHDHQREHHHPLRAL